ncbi:transcriptional regulator [Pseudoalteromonas sp. HM-SA03]|uniref:helix-turn-helix transcriptional regulator n=1 Tax=Pseudoalteromonas sp. HM-SA03 TaxID=2029678 RepID=UPI000BAE4FC0|nr:AlpA family phage regulatory protein [Pseudoalteromonas sp. HM-SA03]PAY01861.1 transcriptional regulator [Pseudoalteromonas sp. HM-SA03]
MSTQKLFKIIRRPEVLSKTGWSKSTLYNRLKEGLFPTPISLGARSVGFVESECDRVIQAMIAGYSEQQLKDMVQSIISSRSVKG